MPSSSLALIRNGVPRLGSSTSSATLPRMTRRRIPSRSQPITSKRWRWPRNSACVRCALLFNPQSRPLLLQACISRTGPRRTIHRCCHVPCYGDTVVALPGRSGSGPDRVGAIARRIGTPKAFFTPPPPAAHPAPAAIAACPARDSPLERPAARRSAVERGLDRRRRMEASSPCSEQRTLCSLQPGEDHTDRFLYRHGAICELLQHLVLGEEAVPTVVGQVIRGHCAGFEQGASHRLGLLGHVGLLGHPFRSVPDERRDQGLMLLPGGGHHQRGTPASVHAVFVPHLARLETRMRGHSPVPLHALQRTHARGKEVFAAFQRHKAIKRKFHHRSIRLAPSGGPGLALRSSLTNNGIAANRVML